MCTANATTMAELVKVQYKYDNQSELFAELYRFLDISPRPTASTEDDVIVMPNAPTKRNNLFFINALSDETSTWLRSMEEAQRRAEYETAKRQLKNLVGDLELHSEHVEVDSYSNMIKEFERYLKETPEYHTPTNITVVFLGHGGKDNVTGEATLCFEDPERPLVSDVFYEMDSKLKNSKVKSSHLSIVFAQCYSYKHNIPTEGNANPREFNEASGYSTKFMFLTCEKAPLTDSVMRYEGQPRSKEGLIQIQNELGVHDIVDRTVLKEIIDNLFDHIKEKFGVKLEQWHFEKWFNSGCIPSSGIPEEIRSNNNCVEYIEKEIENRRMKIKKYLHLAIHEPYSKEAAASVRKIRDRKNDRYPFECKNISSFEEFKDLTAPFLTDDTKVLIIFISCFKKKTELELKFSENKYMPMQKILKTIDEMNSSNKDVRVTFFCEDFVEDVVDGATSTSCNVSIYSEFFAKLANAYNVQLSEIETMKNIAKETTK